MQTWFAVSPSVFLCFTVRSLRAQGCGSEHGLVCLSRGEPRPWPKQLWLSIRKGFQPWVSQSLEAPPAGWAELRMRHKFERWELTDFPRRYTPRVLASLHRLTKLVAPRVQVAVLSALFNRWVTHRRFPSRHFPRRARHCWFGCDAPDSLEHYLRCGRLHGFAARRLGLRLPPLERWPIMLLTVHMPDDQLRKIAVLHYIAYRSYNVAAHDASLQVSERQVQDALWQQCLVEAVRGHAASCRKVLI